MKYLDSVSLARIKNYRFHFRRMLAEGHVSGMHRSVYRGFSQEFAEHREYVPGDDLKFLDWKVYARKDRFFIREFHEEKNLRTYLLVDRSGSMGFSSSPERPSKWDYACHLSVAIAYLILARSDAVGLLSFSDKAHSFVSPGNRMSALEIIDSSLASQEPGGRTNISAVMREAAPRLPRRSLLVLVSDLLGKPAEFLGVSKVLRSQKHEVLVLQVLDPVEMSFDWEGPLRIRDMETGGHIRCEARVLRRAYRMEFERLLKLYESSFHSSGIGYMPFFTDSPWEESLGRFLAIQRSIL